MPLYQQPVIATAVKTTLAIFIGFVSTQSFAAETAVHVVSLSPIDLFRQADIVVKSVMILLILASIASWVIWLAKVFEFKKQKSQLIQSLKIIQGKTSIEDAFEVPDQAISIIQQVSLTEYELAKSKDFFLESSVKERVNHQIDRIIENEKQRLGKGSTFLATVGAIAPFVGLFGTVWGIMHSFVAIAQTNVTNLSVVAPGIAEALFATALGLFAAIPAVILYNHVIRKISSYGLLLEDTATLVNCIFGRDLDHLQEESIKQQRTQGA